MLGRLQFPNGCGMDTEDGLLPFPREAERVTRVRITSFKSDGEAAMKVKFMGAARTVTGSCYILEAAGRRFAIDCGMHQGNAEIEKRNWDVDLYDPHGIEFMLMTHAHMDHSGLLPRLVQKGFRGKVYMTPPTRDLLRIMLLDSAHIQEMEAQWKNRKRLRLGDENITPSIPRRMRRPPSPSFLPSPTARPSRRPPD